MLTLLTVFGLTPGAAAAPYQLIAIYTGHGDTLEVPIDSGGVLPDRGEEYTLDRVVLRFDQSGLGAAMTTTYRNFVVGVDVSGKATHSSLQASSVDPTADVTLLDGADGLPDRITPVSVNVRAKFDASFLCGQELLLRSKAAKRTGTLPRKEVTQNKKKVSIPAFFATEADEPSRPLLDASNVELLYSFCETDAVDWEAVKANGAYDFGLDLSAKELGDEHKERLAKLLAKSGALEQIASASDGLHVAADRDGQPTNVYVEESFDFRVLHTAWLFSLDEYAFDGGAPRRSLVDSRSRLTVDSILSANDCQDLADSHLTFRVGDRGATTEVATAAPRFRHTCSIDLDLDLDLYQQKEMEVTIVWDLEGKGSLTLFREPLHVHKLGLITSFPVISEIAVAAKGGNPADIAEASSVPLGVSIPFTGGDPRASVTFPWKLGFNTRAAPNLATYISFFPHVTLQFPVDGAADDTVSVGVGAGLALAEAFHFAWSVDTTSGEHALVVGVSVTDIAEVVNLVP